MKFGMGYRKKTPVNGHMRNYMWIFLVICMALFGMQPSVLVDAKHQNRECYSAIYSFGDSLADTGNLLISGAQQFGPISELPYGQTYFNKPTGRCSNGRLIVDFIAQAYGFQFLPPFLDKHADFSNGANFAVAGATAMDASFFEERHIEPIFTNFSLDTQIEWFKTFKENYCYGTPDCADHFENALFLIGEIGGNDYNYPFAQGRSLEEVSTFVPLIVQKIKGAIEELIDEGAKKFFVQGNLPIGCSPFYLTTQQTNSSADLDHMGCLVKFNNFSQYSNLHIRNMLLDVQGKHQKISIIYADYFSAALKVLSNPKQYGLQRNVLRVCCGRGGKYNFSPPTSCSPNVSSCLNPEQYFNWDGVHLTETAYRTIAKMFVDGKFTTPKICRQKVHSK